MDVRQAAVVIGVSEQHIRLLIRRGLLKAKKVTRGRTYFWDISEREASRIRACPSLVGRPRGALNKSLSKQDPGYDYPNTEGMKGIDRA